MTNFDFRKYEADFKKDTLLSGISGNVALYIEYCKLREASEFNKNLLASIKKMTDLYVSIKVPKAH